MEFLEKQIEDYISAHSNKEPKILADLNRETWAKVLMPRMLSGHIQGRVLSLFSKLLKPLNIIEIGTYTGYSALCLAEGMRKDGELHTIEINEEHALIADKYFKQSKFSKNIKQHIGNALEIIPKIDKKFQLAFIDADKENYSKYFDLIIKKIDINGVIIADNVLWSGKVIKKHMDDETKALDNYNKKVLNDSRVENILLSVRDGLMICRKI
jgi:caffeoyl-CoA O-methyltransferase